MQCYGSIYEANQQLIRLEADGEIDAIMSEDGDEIALSAKRLFCKMSRRANGSWQFREFCRLQFFHPNDPYKAKLSRHPHLSVDVALLLGNDYCPRLEKNGPKTVIGGTLPRQPHGLSKKDAEIFRKTRVRNEDSILDFLASSEDPVQWLVDKGWNGNKPMPIEHVPKYLAARRYMFHAPVLQQIVDAREVHIVPLSPLPAGLNLSVDPDAATGPRSRPGTCSSRRMF